MYKDYFRFSEMPFSIAPDPRFLFMSDRHREAIAHLLYGVQGEGGIVLLTGEVGTGKTTVCRSLLDQLPENIDVAFILNPRMSVEELLQTVCEEFHIAVAPAGPGIKAYVDAIHAQLLAANARGRHAILIVDEAQNLDPSVLEQLRLLTNLETNTRKLLQIFLIGQPELQDMLARPEMRQVAQRVVARYHLTQLDQTEVHAYVAHRLRVSGAPSDIFPDSLMKPLYRASGGVPRLINLVCDRALLGTYVQGRQHVSAPTLRQAVREVVAARRPRRPSWALVAGLMALASAAVVAATGLTNAVSIWPPPWLATASPVTLAVQAQPPAAPPQAELLQRVSMSAEPTTQPTRSVEPAALPPKGPEPAAALSPTATVERPSGVALANSETLAFQSLFKLYGMGADAQVKEDPCRQAAEQGMRCYAGRGGLSDLLLLDQPVVMRLSSADGREYSVVLTALDMDHQAATLKIGGDDRRVALNELANAWSGRYVLLWKAPPGFRDSLALNQRGPAVAWLRQAMATVDGVHDDGDGKFDAALAQRIRAFQLAEGIQPDGVVGPLTAIRLNVRSGQGGPHLSAGKKG